MREFDRFRTTLPMFILLLVSSPALAQKTVPRFEIGAQFSLLSLQRPSQIVGNGVDPCCDRVVPGTGRRTEPGVGVRFTYNLMVNIAFETEGNLFPRKETNGSMPGGRIFQGQFGLKAGKRFRKFGIFGKARPGFVGFSEVTKLISTSTIGPTGPLNQVFTVGRFDTRKEAFNVMHHMMKKAATIWSKDTGIDRNPADQVEVKRPDDQRDRYLSQDELRRLKEALDEKIYRKGTNDFNKTFCRLRLIVLIAVTTGMRASEIFGLRWSDVMYNEGLLAVRMKLKGGKMRYAPMLPELAQELRRFTPRLEKDNVAFIANHNNELIFPPKADATSGRQRVEGSFEDLLERAGIEDFRFHDLRHTFASWYMMSGGDLYELAKILGHSNIKMTERYAKLARQHIARTSSTAREMWKLLEPACETANVG